MQNKKLDARNFNRKNRRICKKCFKQLTRDDVKHKRRLHKDCIGLVDSFIGNFEGTI